MASNALLWELTKNFNSMMVKRKECNTVFTRDPFNLTGEHKAKAAGFSNDKAIGITLDTATGKKKKGVKAVFKIVVKHRKYFLAKKAKAPHRRTPNTFATEMPVKRGLDKAVKAIQSLKTFRTDLQRPALKRIAALHAVSVHKMAIKKVEKKPEEKKAPAPAK